MKDQIASEIRKLTSTRSAYWLLAGLALVVAFTSASVVGADQMTTNIDAPLEHQPFLVFPLTVTTVFTMILGIRSFTDEFRHGSIVPTLLASPDRRRVLGAKLVAVSAASVVYAVVAFGTALAVGAIGLAVQGGELSWSAGAVAAMGGNLVVASALWGAIGVGVGLAVRHQLAAIVGMFLWSLVVESALGALVPGVARYLPDAAGSAIVGVDAANLLTPGFAVAVLAGWAALAAVVGGQLMQRRDVA
ncbi:MAG TPA: ABC transporter permease [Actinomycetota bacterium]|nr:ABC transporter permease [Actinomycetota bacterium]